MVTRATRRFLSCLSLGLMMSLPVACSSDDAGAPQEPVAPGTEAAPNPEDPGLAGGEGLDKPADAKPGDTETVGELSSDTLGGQPSSAADQPAAGAAPTDEMPKAGTDDALQGAFEDSQPQYEPTPGTTAPETTGKSSVKGKQTRYVKAAMLNVRSKASLKAPVVHHLTGGTMIHVEIHGKWAKIKDGQWVRTRYLSSTPTKKVSKKGAKGAKKAGKHKKTKAHAKAGKKSKAKAEPAAAEAPAPDVTQPTEAAPPAPEMGAGEQP